MYEPQPGSSPLSQGDIIDQCPIFGLDAPSGGETNPDAEPMRWRVRVVVLTQACDLAQTKTTRVLVALVHDARELARQGLLKEATIRDQVRRGLVYGWYFLPASSPEIDVPESIVDL